MICYVTACIEDRQPELRADNFFEPRRSKLQSNPGDPGSPLPTGSKGFLATDETQMSVLALALALALAIQNLFWGLCLPFAGMLADRFGARLVITAGALVYAAKCFVRRSRLHG